MIMHCLRAHVYVRHVYAHMDTRWNPVRPKLAQLHSNNGQAGMGSIVSADLVPFGKYVCEMVAAEFCLTPPGYAPWSFRFYEALVVSCIPVLFDDQHEVFPWEGQLDYESMVV